MPGLRPYQIDCIRSILWNYEHGVNRQVVVGPTGFGKTRVFSELPESVCPNPDSRSIVLVHRDELATQAANSIARLNPNLKVGVEKAAQFAGDADVVIGSVQTLSGKNGGARLWSFQPKDFGLVIVDECHHTTSASYVKILEHFCVNKQASNDSDALLVGVSATPNRTDGLGLEICYDKVVYKKPLLDMIRDGWLSQVVAERIRTGTDISDAKLKNGGFGKDFAAPGLSPLVNSTQRNSLVVREYLKTPNLPALCFCVDVAHAEAMYSMFQKAGVSAATVLGTTKPRDRQEAFERFHSQDLQVLIGVDVFSEGTDLPVATIGLMARPTHSPAWYQQAVGRLLRRWPPPESIGTHGYIKQVAIVKDFVDNSAKHTLVTAPTLFGLPAAFDTNGKSLVKAAEEVEQLRLQHNGLLPLDGFTSINELQIICDRVDMLAQFPLPPEAKRFSRFEWSQIGPDTCALYIHDDKLLLEIKTNLLGQREVYATKNGYQKCIGTGNAREAFWLADSMVNASYKPVLERSRKWRRKIPSEKQINLLFNLNRDAFQQQYGNRESFSKHIMTQFHKGDKRWDRGTISQMINVLKMKEAKQ